MSLLARFDVELVTCSGWFLIFDLEIVHQRVVLISVAVRIWMAGLQVGKQNTLVIVRDTAASGFRLLASTPVN